MAEWEDAPVKGGGWEDAPAGKPQGIPPEPHGIMEPLKNVGATARGFVAGTLGLPGEAEKWAQWYGQKIGVPDRANQRILPDVEEMGQKLPFKPQERQKGFESIGETLGTMLGPQAALGTVRKGIGAAKTIGDVGERILPGATQRAESKLAEIGTPTDKSILGQQLSDRLTQRMNTLRSERRVQAEANYKNYFTEEADKAPQVISEFNSYLAEQLGKTRDLAPVEQGLIEDAQARLTRNPSIEGLEKELRYLKAVGKQPDIVEGYKAIPTGQARDMASKLESILNKIAPKGKIARATYEEASSPLDVYSEILGRTATDAEKDPALLPSRFFKTKYSVNKLRELSGDENFVRQSAKEYIATELEGKSASEANTWFKHNKIWLDEMPEIRDSTKAYVDNLNKTAKTQTRAKEIGIGAAAVGGLGAGYSTLRHFLGL